MNNVEIKAKCAQPEKIRNLLEQRNAEFKGTDYQVDTYFNCRTGRLKLRQGNIENYLIHYQRENKQGPKDSLVTLFKTTPETNMKQVLEKALGILVEVKKQREIYFIGNVKFHIDEVEQLGNFVEIEAINDSGQISRERLLAQCREYMKLFGIEAGDLIDCSYSDLLLRNK